MESRIRARTILNENYKQIMSAFSSICTQLEFGETGSQEKINTISAFYTVVFFNAKTIPPVVSHIDLYMIGNPEITLSEDDQNLAAEILVENHIHELKLSGMIEVKPSESGLYEIYLTNKGKQESKKSGKDIRII